jgi:hypothetical protein
MVENHHQYSIHDHHFHMYLDDEMMIDLLAKLNQEIYKYKFYIYLLYMMDKIVVAKVMYLIDLNHFLMLKINHD